SWSSFAFSLALTKVHPTGGAASGTTSAAELKNRKWRIWMWQRNNLLDIGRAFLQTLRRFLKMRKMNARRTAGAIAMFWNGDPEGVGAQMSDLAEKIHGGFGVTAFEFTVGGAHGTESLDLTARANGLARAGRLANFAKTLIPSFRETAVTQVVAVLMGDHTDGHATGGVDGTAILP